jgi:hypothetical protein
MAAPPHRRCSAFDLTQRDGLPPPHQGTEWLYTGCQQRSPPVLSVYELGPSQNFTLGHGHIRLGGACASGRRLDVHPVMVQLAQSPTCSVFHRQDIHTRAAYSRGADDRPLRRGERSGGVAIECVCVCERMGGGVRPGVQGRLWQVCSSLAWHDPANGCSRLVHEWVRRCATGETPPREFVCAVWSDTLCRVAQGVRSSSSGCVRPRRGVHRQGRLCGSTLHHK